MNKNQLGIYLTKTLNNISKQELEKKVKLDKMEKERLERVKKYK